MTINPLLIYKLNQIPLAHEAVIYWMSRDQRVNDNWALLHAQSLALERQQPLAVVFTLADSFLGATLRQFGFMLRGNPPDEICRFIQGHPVGALVTDFDPLRVKRGWHDQVAESISSGYSEDEVTQKFVGKGPTCFIQNRIN